MKRIVNRTLIVLLFPFLISACDSSSSGPSAEVVSTDISIGNGADIVPGQAIFVAYVGKFVGGTVFDSSEELGKDFLFTLGVGQVIQGWDEGLLGMRVGGTRRLEIPSHLAFGKKGQTLTDGTIVVPPNTDVIYEVTIVDIFDEVLIEDIIPGEGDVAEFADVLFVEYIGQLPDGSVFDASAISGGEFIFTLGAGSVIQGWELGMIGMKVGGKRKLTIPPILAYGGRGAGSIPPWTVITFEVDLNSLIKFDG